MATVPWNVFPAGIKCGKNLAVIISSVHGTSLNGHQTGERAIKRERGRVGTIWGVRIIILLAYSVFFFFL